MARRSYTRHMKRDAPNAQGEFDLGGVRWPRPFRIRRLGHFGICVADPEAGRDLPGSNWHFYPPDPEGHTNELYYGIEQIGWDGYSKPREMYGVRYAKPPQLPHKSELAEVMDATAHGIPIEKGLRAVEAGEEKYDVGGILLARPFKIVRHGPVRLFVENMEAMLAFYRDDLGFTVTEEVEYKGHRCVFLRANTEHHCMALYPIALRDELGLSAHTTLMSFGLQMGSYRQLQDA